MKEQFYELLEAELSEISEQGLEKPERVLESAQSREILVGGKKLLNFCANNYLGLANSSQIREAAKLAIDEHGVGMASVRFICGTQDLHKRLESELAEFLHTEDCILYSSCFDANAGLFETLLGPNDAVFSDSLNHASIIDGIRLSKARRFRFLHNDLEELRRFLAQAKSEGAEKLLISSDGVFSMDGDIVKLPEILAIAREFGALLHLDDSHATGVLGVNGRGSAEHFGLLGEVDIITSTLGKSLGGSAGGFTAARKPVIKLLRQRSRPYLFSNSIAPAVAGAALACLKILRQDSVLQEELRSNMQFFRDAMAKAGFTLRGADHPIVPIMIGEARAAQEMAEELLSEGIYVIGFSFPVVPQGEARIRVQVSAEHRKEDLRQAVAAFVKVGRRRGILKG